MAESPIEAATEPPRGESQQNVRYIINFVHKQTVADSFSVFFIYVFIKYTSFISKWNFVFYFAHSTNQGS